MNRSRTPLHCQHIDLQSRIQGHFLSSLAIAKPRFYVCKFGQHTKVTLGRSYVGEERRPHGAQHGGVRRDNAR